MGAVLSLMRLKVLLLLALLATASSHGQVHTGVYAHDRINWVAHTSQAGATLATTDLGTAWLVAHS